MKKARISYIIIGIVIFVIICSVSTYAIKNRPQPKSVAAITSSNTSSSTTSSETVSSSVSSQTTSSKLTGTDPTEATLRQRLKDSGLPQEQIDQSVKELYNDGTLKNQTPAKPSTSSNTTNSKPSNGTTSNKPSNSKPSSGTNSSNPSTNNGKDNTGDQGTGVYAGPSNPLGGGHAEVTHIAPGTGSSPVGPVEGHYLH